MKHVWSIICERSILNKDTNNLSCIELIEQLNITKKKEVEKKDSKIILPVYIELISLWYDEDIKKERSAETKVEVYDFNKKKINEFIYPFVMPKNMKRARTIMKLNGLPVSGSGLHIFKIMLKDKGTNKYNLVSEIPININIIEKEIK